MNGRATVNVRLNGIADSDVSILGRPAIDE
jgi:hypothetical protein